MEKVHIGIILDRRYQHQDGRFPVKLRIRHRGRKRLFGIGLSLTPEQWQQVNQIRPKEPARTWKNQIGQVIQKADQVVQEMKRFTFLEFQRLMFGDGRRNLTHWYQVKIDLLRKEHRWSTLDVYTNSRNSLPDGLMFDDVTPAWLRQYEQRMSSLGRSDTTISIYLRCLRAIFNDAIRSGAVHPDQYPFGPGGYQIPRHRNIKKALTLEQIRTLSNLDINDPARRRAVDLFLFSYFCNGMNLADIARMRWTDIDSGVVVFSRTKLHGRRGHGRAVRVVLTEPARQIINRWGHPDQPFIFGICSMDVNEREQRRAVKLETRRVNNYLQKVCRDVPGLPDDISFNFARHSFATVLKRSGVPVSFISEALGHSSERVTEHYLSSFELDQQRAFLQFLLPD